MSKIILPANPALPRRLPWAFSLLFCVQARAGAGVIQAQGDVLPVLAQTDRIALAVAGVLAVGLLLAVAWIVSLQRRLQRQAEEIRARQAQLDRREAAVLRSAQLESLGVLASGIGHDFNNLLTVILGNLSMMKFSPRLMETEAQRMADLERGVTRARDLARQLLSFAGSGEPRRAPVDLEETARTATDTVLRGTSVVAEYAVAAGLWAAAGDRDQLVLVVQNIVHNAMQAMPGGGTVRLGLANEDVVAGSPGGAAPGRYVRLTVSDGGPGIPAENLGRIFEPYFTTKLGARGLGLTTVHSLVTRHGGRVEAARKTDRGATLIVWLPASSTPLFKPEPAAARPASAPVVPALAPTPTPTPSSPPAASAAPTAKPRVLIMDDEEGVRELAIAIFRRMGLDGTAVQDGESALREFEMARNAGRPFALLIVDLTVPGGLGGRQTVEAVRKLDPQVPAIVTSGYSSDPVMADFRAHGFQAVVPKPFEITALASAVRQFIPQAKPL